MKVTVATRGGEDLSRRLAAYGGLNGPRLLRPAADAIAAEALALLSDGEAPETRSGALAASLTVTTLPDGSLSVGSDAPHAWYAEFGTRMRPSRGWLGLAARRTLPSLKSLWRRLGAGDLRQAGYASKQTGASS